MDLLNNLIKDKNILPIMVVLGMPNPNFKIIHFNLLYLIKCYN